MTDKSTDSDHFFDLEYFYRDSDNFKQWSHVTLHGEISMQELEACLYEGEFFIPRRVGLPDLTPEMATASDHPWHILGRIEKTSNSNALIEAGELIARFKLQSALNWGQSIPEEARSLGTAAL
jgi:hypothetical protein